MIKKIVPLTVLVAFVFQITGCFFPTSSTVVKGKVVDYKKQAVPGAKVTFGGAGSEVETVTGSDGTFTITARHRPAQMLNLKIAKYGVGRFQDKFPGFAAPDDGTSFELMPILGEIPSTR